MTIKNTLSKGYGLLMGVALFSVLFLAQSVTSLAQFNRPAIPVLSLVGDNGSYDRQWYPDGRIWMAPNKQGVREFLMPVFIDNRWYTYDSGDTIVYQAPPIKSFQFSIQYDSAAVRPVGVQTHGPRHHEDDLDYAPLADGFNLEWWDYQDFTYKEYLGVSTPDRFAGRRMTIVGSSSRPLPNTDLDFQEYKVLLYVRFRVIPDLVTGLGTAGTTPIYISNDTIKYNDLNVCLEAPFKDMRPYNSETISHYPDPVRRNYNSIEDEYTGLGGINNKTWNNPAKDRVIPGVIWLRYFSSFPAFQFDLNRQIGQQPGLEPESLPAQRWVLHDPMTVDMNQRDPNFPTIATRRIEILNSESNTRLKDIEVESNAPWLRFRTLGTYTPNPIPTATDKGTIPYLDNGILGSLLDDLGNDTDDDGLLSLEIRCDPSFINAGEDNQERPEIEKTGIYVGYITFKSHFANISPVRIKVTFIYFRPPLEGQRANARGGINIQLFNRSNDETRIIYGTGDRGSRGVDTLFGEFAYQTPLPTNRLAARFYPVGPDGQEYDVNGDLPGGLFGLGDFSTNDEQRKSESRDIRNADDTLRSLIYKVKFNSGPGVPAQNYPITLEWDIRDFPEGAQSYIRDTQNGQLFPAVNMRNANPLGQFRRSFKIDDPRITEFLIEYTVPRVINYVDRDGEPIIKRGWNFLSMPVAPLNNLWNNVYPNAMNKPYYFFLSSYQQEELLRPGVGYFVRYGNVIDVQFAGTFLSRISKNQNPVRVYPGDENGGWNTVGALSIPVDVTQIDFSPLDLPGSVDADRAYTLGHGVYGYVNKEGYKEVSQMNPGFGYWIKVDGDGYFEIEANNIPDNPGPRKLANTVLAEKEDIRAKSDVIVISDNQQFSKGLFLTQNTEVDVRLFELPPVPPAFDVRFIDGTELTNTNETVIELNNVEYPVAISMENAKSTLTFSDAITGEVFGTISKGSNGNIEIRESSNAIKVTSTETVADKFVVTGYPNPVVSTSLIDINLPEKSFVTINMYDEVGNLVKVLANEEMSAGAQTLEINADEFRSGSYLVRVNAGSFTKTIKLTVIK